MSILFRLQAIFIVTIKRLLSQRGLALATAVGLTAAIGFTLSIPIYADAVYYRILRQSLSQDAERANHPPFAYMFTYIGAWAGDREWQDVQAADEYLSRTAGPTLALPQDLVVRHFETGILRLFPSGEVAYEDDTRALTSIAFAFTGDIGPHISIVEGSFPAAAGPDDAGPIEVLVAHSLAQELGLQTGENYIVFNPNAEGSGQSRDFPVRIAGIWQPKNAAADFWFYAPSAFHDLLLVPEATFIHRLGPAISNEIHLALWYLVMDGQGVHADNADQLVVRSNRVEQRFDALLPRGLLQVSPVDALRQYRQSVNGLTILLYAFSVPILGLILAFIGLVVGLSVNERRNEIAVMRSRGATAGQIIGIAMLEGLLLGLLTLLAGAFMGLLLTQLMGRARSFLDFSGASNLRVGLPLSVWRFGAVAVALALLAQALPTMSAARHTIITYKQERARTLVPPWWQRAWLDVLLFIPAVYGFYLLRQQGSIVTPLDSSSGAASLSADPFQNPLLFLVPALLIFSLTLLFLRLMPLIVGAVSWLLSYTNSVGLLLATRYLSRTPGFYAAPLILLVLTVSLSLFTASLAQTMDFHLYDQMYYRTGADLTLLDIGQTASSSGAVAPGAASEAEPFFFLPVSAYQELAGVAVATRVGRYHTTVQVGEDTLTGTFIGVDRVDFNKVAFWRWDFAPARLGSLLNALALTPDGVLAPRELLRQNALILGDTIRLRVNLYGNQVEMNTQIVGAFDYFPTWYPEQDGPLIVGNLENLYEQVGGEFPYQVWLRTTPDFDPDAFSAGLREQRFRAWQSSEPLSFIEAEQVRPERQGLFGLLSVGFAAAALLTVLGFFLYALFSFRRRFIELGILRAVGLSTRQMVAFLAGELAFLILTGLTLGTALGAWISRQFIPYLQIGSSEAALVPPYLVEIAWPATYQIFILFSLLFVVALGALAMLLLRMKIFQAVKLGETT
jgi:putative ABC transport system permease protein